MERGCLFLILINSKQVAFDLSFSYHVPGSCSICCEVGKYPLWPLGNYEYLASDLGAGCLPLGLPT